MLVRSAMELGHLVRERRQARHLTQAGLANIVGVSRKWIVGLEAGKRTSDLSLVLRTLNAIGLGVDVRERAGGAARGATDLNAIVGAVRKPGR